MALALSLKKCFGTYRHYQCDELTAKTLTGIGALHKKLKKDHGLEPGAVATG